MNKEVWQYSEKHLMMAILFLILAKLSVASSAVIVLYVVAVVHLGRSIFYVFDEVKRKLK